MKLNENIRKFRLFRNMTQEELAKRLSKSKSVISHWEKGENSPDLDSCEALCKILNVSPNELFGWEENPEFLAWSQRLQKYQKEIDDLMIQRDSIEAQINRLEKKKFEECPPDWA